MLFELRGVVNVPTRFIVSLYHTQAMIDSRAYDFETMWSSTLFLHIIRFAISCRIFNRFQNFIFFKFPPKIKISKNLLTPICAGGSIKEWVCSVTREKDGDTRIWVPRLTLSSLIAWKWWNCILIDYVPSQQGRAAIHSPERSLRSVECVLMHNNTIFPFLHLLSIYLFKWHKVFCAGSFVPLNCRKNKVDAIYPKKT